jgi:hypothetical protein
MTGKKVVVERDMRNGMEHGSTEMGERSRSRR